MRFVVFGAGAIGGTVAAALALAGDDVVVIARGPHLDAIQRHGLRFRSPGLDTVVPLAAVAHPDDITWGDDDIVLLATKTQQTAVALDDLAGVTPPSTPIVCLQNGVGNEPMALRRFEAVHGVCVMSPAAHLEPGVVACYSAPAYGILDIGRYPGGLDATDERVADAFRRAGYGSAALADIMRSKYAKLLDNLANVIEALCPPGPDATELALAARAEGEAVLRAVGIDWGADDPAVSHRRDGVYRLTPINGERRAGGSTWQSLARGTGNLEVDHLNGEIVFLGRLHGIASPLNTALQLAAATAVQRRAPAGSLSPAAIMAGGAP